MAIQDLTEYSSPCFRSLSGRELIMGVPPLVAYAIGGLAVFFVFYLRLWLSIPVFIVVFLVARAFSKKDEYLLDVILLSLLDVDELKI